MTDRSAKDADAPFWERAYADPSVDPFGPVSDEIVALAPRLPRGARVLDLGCGDGRNALFLAQTGLAVDAVDQSATGVDKLASRASRAGVPVHTWVQDITTLDLAGAYGLVVAHGVLHLLERPAWSRLLRAMQEWTAPGGWNVVAVFTDRLPTPPDLEPHTGGLFQEGELRDLYDHWHVELWHAYTLEDEHPGGIRHQHAVNKIVARRPLERGPDA